MKMIIPKGRAGEMSSRAVQFEYMLRAAGLSYEVVKTKSTITITPDNEAFKPQKFIAAGLKAKDLQFISKVVRHFQGMKPPKLIRPSGKVIRYNGYTANMNVGEYRGIIEIDVSGAYWEQANKLGYLGEELYREGKDTEQVEKRTRLISLGALAKKTEILHYSPPDYRPKVKVKERPTWIFWDNICYTFGNAMDQVFWKFPGQIMGYWVDAVFCMGTVAALTKKAFEDQGYPVTIKRIEKMEIRVYPHDERKLQILRYLPDGRIKELPPFIPGRRPDSFNSLREKMLAEIEKHLT
jgi:hypothetical protein